MNPLLVRPPSYIRWIPVLLRLYHRKQSGSLSHEARIDPSLVQVWVLFLVIHQLQGHRHRIVVTEIDRLFRAVRYQTRKIATITRTNNQTSTNITELWFCYQPCKRHYKQQLPYSSLNGYHSSHLSKHTFLKSTSGSYLNVNYHSILDAQS